MDIIVTTPKAESLVAKKEAAQVAADPGAFWFRTLRGPNVAVGDRVYYVDHGVIAGYGVIFDIEHGAMWDDTHNIEWNGTHLKQREWHQLVKRVGFRGFQGFRYIDRVAGLRGRLLAAEQ
jgi:hypothetical protein